MSSNKRFDNKAKIKKLINIGLFDDHIEELSKALYTKRLFTKDIKCYFNNKSNKLDNYLIQKTLKKNNNGGNTSNKNKNNKNYITTLKKSSSGDINFYEFNKYKEKELNEDMKNLLISLNNSQDETKSKFQELKEENDYFSSLYKVYKELRNLKTRKANSDNDNNLFIFLYDLLIKYKSKKKLSFDINSLFSDILRETPLAETDLDKLKFYYIINPERFDIINDYINNKHTSQKKENKINPLFAMYNNESANNSFKNEMPKEPRIIDMTKMKYLKEIQYLKKVNKRTKFKIIKGGNIIGMHQHKTPKLIHYNSNKQNNRYINENGNLNKNENENKENSNEDNEEEESEDEDNYYYDNNINEKQQNILNNTKKNKKQLQLEIEKDKKDINILKNTIKDFFNDENNNLKKLKESNSYFNLKKNYSFNKSNRNEFKKNTFFSIDNENINNKIINNKKFEYFNPRISRHKIQRNTSYDKFSNFNDYKFNDIFYKTKKNNDYNNSTFLSNKNNYQHSTYYSNQSYNNLINNSKFSPNNSTSLSNKLYNTPKNKIIFNGYKLNKNYTFNVNKENSNKNKELKKSKTILSDEKDNNLLLDNIIKNKTDNIYYISKKINGKNKNEYIQKINDYFKYTNSKLPLLYKKNDFKDTFFFFHRLKQEIQNNDIKYKYQNARKFLNDKERKKLYDIEVLDSLITDKEKELLIKVLKRKL